jgi:hypothetical protein
MAAKGIRNRGPAQCASSLTDPPRIPTLAKLRVLIFQHVICEVATMLHFREERIGNTNEQSRTDSSSSAATSLLALDPHLHARTHLGAFVDGFLIEAWRLEITHPRRMRSIALELGFTFGSKLILEVDFGRSNSTASQERRGKRDQHTHSSLRNFATRQPPIY